MRATLPSRPAALLHEDTDLRHKIARCFTALFCGARQGHVQPGAGLFLGKAECEWDWQEVWPAMKDLGLVDYKIDEVTHPTGCVTKDFRWNVTEKGHDVRDDDNKYFEELMTAMGQDREAEGPTLADALKAEGEVLRRRFVHHTRPKEPMDLEQSIALSAWMDSDS